MRFHDFNRFQLSSATNGGVWGSLRSRVLMSQHSQLGLMNFWICWDFYKSHKSKHETIQGGPLSGAKEPCCLGLQSFFYKISTNSRESPKAAWSRKQVQATCLGHRGARSTLIPRWSTCFRFLAHRFVLTHLCSFYLILYHDAVHHSVQFQQCVLSHCVNPYCETS